MYKRHFKRIFDFTISFILILLLLPVYILTALMILLTMGRPVLFVQERPGLNEKIFKIYKFRSMRNRIDKKGNLFPDEQRVTKLGTLLRKSSIDELPELYNVLKRDMSLVGPRPLIERYLPYYSEREQKRHSILPGITGLAQITGRNYLDWNRRLELDVEYVERISFLLDLKIIYKTIVKVIKSEDVGLNIMTDLDIERKAILSIKDE